MLFIRNLRGSSLQPLRECKAIVFVQQTFVGLQIVLPNICVSHEFHHVFCIAGNRDALKGLGIGILLAVFAQFTASLAITCYAVLIIKKSGTSLNPYTSSIVCAVTPIFGSLLSTYLADKLGRRVLNCISLTGCAIGLFGLSLYQYLKVHDNSLSSFDWFPVFCLSFVVFMASAGILPLSIICSVENLPPKVCNQALYLTYMKPILIHFNQLNRIFSGSNVWNDVNQLINQFLFICFLKTSSNSDGKTRTVWLFSDLWNGLHRWSNLRIICIKRNKRPISYWVK